MPLLNSEKPKNNLNSLNSETQKPTGLVNIIGNFLPLAPILYEQWTGQKIPQMTGTIGEIQNNLIQLSLTLNQILNNQNQLWNKLENLEKSANQAFRLTHTREKREIELNPQLE